MTRFLLCGSFAVAALSVASYAQASLIRITPTGVASDDQAITSPVPIDGDGFRLTYHSQGGGNDEILNPLTLIIATPDGAASPTLADGTAQDPAGLSVSPFTVDFFGEWSGTPNNVYDFLGLSPDPGGPSQNYTNWTGAIADYGLAPVTTWDIYTASIVFTPNFDVGNWNEFTADLVAGTFVVGWGCTSTDSASSCDSAQATPFTFAGMVTTVPEPGTLALLGTGLIGIALSGRRRRKLAS